MSRTTTNNNAPLVFITGASSGIGRSLAARYYQRGWRLALAARRCVEVQEWAHGQGFAPDRWSVYAVDVRDTAATASAGQRCIEQQGVPDVVIANAGISIGMDTAEFGDLEVMRAIYETNVIGMAATFHPFIRPMRQRRSGTLVGIASVAGIRGLPGHGAYCSSKAAVISYCESLRGELRPQGVKVVTLLPGYVDTPLTRDNRYPMPFLMSSDDFAKRACRAIASGTGHRVIPWQMAIVAKLLRLVPDALFDRLAASQPRKQRLGE